MFEQGFIKGAVENGVDPDFISGLAKGAEDQFNTICLSIKKAAQLSGDPMYSVKLAYELFELDPQYMDKQSFDTSTIQNFLNNPQIHQLLKSIGGKFGGGEGVGGGIAGFGGGSLLGLILGKLLFNDPMKGMMLLGAGGAGLGAAYGNHSFDSLFQHTNPSQGNPSSNTGGIPYPAMQPGADSPDKVLQQHTQDLQSGNIIPGYPTPATPSPTNSPQIGGQNINNPALTPPKPIQPTQVNPGVPAPAPAAQANPLMPSPQHQQTMVQQANNNAIMGKGPSISTPLPPTIPGQQPFPISPTSGGSSAGAPKLPPQTGPKYFPH